MPKVNIPTTKLNNGEEMPVLGVGTWLGLSGGYLDGELMIEDVGKLVETMSYAIDVGYRHIDTAHFYRIEPEVGDVVREKIAKGVVTRKEMFITTKVWQTAHREADVVQSVKNSLKRLGMDYVDLALMHWPMSFNSEGEDEKIDFLETWNGFETVYRLGFAKAIGVSNFNVEQLKRLLENCTVPPACNQIEINLNLAQNELVELCHSNNIAVTAYSPFGTMIPSKTVDDSPEPKLNSPTMVVMARKYGKTVTQIVLRYLYERGIVSIPKTVTPSRVLENASIFDFKLDASDKTVLSSYDVGFRTVRPLFFQKYENYPFDKIDCGEVEMPKAMLQWKNGAELNID